MSTVPPDHRGYDRFPAIAVPPDGSDAGRVSSGAAVWTTLRQRAEAASATPLIIIDTYPGVDLAALTAAAHRHLPGYRVVDVEAAAARPIEEIDALLARNLTDDRVFGVLSHHRLDELYDQEKLASTAALIRDVPAPTVVLGWGAAQLLLDHAADAAVDGPAEGSAGPTAVVVLADLPRWELQQRYRRGMPNWRCANGGQDVLRKVKRGYFVEWRIADRHKRRLFPIMDFLLDTTRTVDDAHLVTAEAFRAGLDARHVRAVPAGALLRPGVWGGTWMADVVGLEAVDNNYAWCFDCVPEENSLLLDVDGTVVEIPAMDLVLSRPRELLGPLTFARFGAEFPIRFDFLDTMEGGNLSLQVHPLTDYITDTFGMTYTQDESYYLLDAGEDAGVYLGLRDDADVDQMFRRAHGGPGRAAPVRRRGVREPVPGREARPLPDPGRHGALLGAQLHGAGDLGHPVPVHLQDVGLGPARTGRRPASGPPRPRPGQRADRSTDDLGVGEPGAPHRGAGHRAGLGGGADRSARARVHRGPPTLVHRTGSARHRGHGQRAQPRRGCRRRSSPARQAPSSRTSSTTPRRSSCRPRSVRYTITPYGTSVGQRLGTVKAYVRGTATASMGIGGRGRQLSRLRLITKTTTSVTPIATAPSTAGGSCRTRSSTSSAPDFT